MLGNRTLAALGLWAALAACDDPSTHQATEPDLGLAESGTEPQAAALRWSTTRLSLGTGSATDVNNKGQIVGSHFVAGGVRAFVWSNGTLQSLGTLGGGGSWATAINEAGQVVGQSDRADGLWHAFLWQNGTMRDLGALEDDYSSATAIDGNGRVIGYTLNSEGEPRAFLWENGRMTRLTGLGTGYSEANGIDNQGRIVGAYGTQDSPRAFRWAAGVVTDLGTLGGATASASAIVGGRIVGASAKATGVERAFLWQNGSMTGLGALSGGSSSAGAINALGHVVGRSQQPDSQPRAVIWRDGTLSAIAVGVAEDVNRADWVVGSGSVPFPVLWRETTDPPPPAGSILVSSSFFVSDRNWTTDPAVDTIAVGTRVTWTWVRGSHSVQSVQTPSFPSSSVVNRAGATYSFTFTQPGTYRYNCAVHPRSMTGRVVVR